MSSGPDPEHPDAAYREAVATLHANRPEQGVPAEAVKKHFKRVYGVEYSLRHVRRRLNDLCDAGALERVEGYGSGGQPPWWYYPPEDAES